VTCALAMLLSHRGRYKKLKVSSVAICIVLAALTGAAIGQVPLPSECQLRCSLVVWRTVANTVPYTLFAEPVSPFPITPETALQVFERGNERQAAELRGYTATTLITVELLDMSQRGEFELQRVYVAPKTLQFTPVRFTGDNFVKNNVIARLLQSEVDHLQNPQQFATAVNEANYKITYAGTTQVDGRIVHAYQLKPRKRRLGLFEGRMFLDAFNGNLVRNEGRLVQTPSFVLKKVEFTQDYMDIGPFTFLKHTHSVASTRLVGRTTVDVYNSDYRFPSAAPDAVVGRALAPADEILQEH